MKIKNAKGFRQGIQVFSAVGLLAGAVFFASCAEAPSPAPAPMVETPALGDGVVERATVANKAVMKKRTGIATGWGREVNSSMSYTNFTRSRSKPLQVSTMRYNDTEGSKSMGVDRSTKTGGMQQVPGGLISWGLSGKWGMLNNYWWRGGRFVIGKKGSEYSLKVKNHSNVRLEVVLSVDGLDVIDGKSASVKKRGYIIGAGKTLVVKGFRSSHDSVATFKFTSVSGSYANLKHGQTRNVGVIGMAVFTEKGAEPGREVGVRGGARAFAEAPNVRARD